MPLNKEPEIIEFLNGYDAAVLSQIEKYRLLIKKQLSGISEQLDLPARMISFSFGQSYADVICTLILSKKGVKLGFYSGSELPDPFGLLTGKGKVHRFVELKPEINVSHISDLLNYAYQAYLLRMKK
jgi:hypothetical protein